MITQEENKTPVYMTVRQIAEDPAFCFSIPMLRYYLHQSHRNGLKSAIRRIGARKILIRRDLFIEWIEKQARK